MIDMTILDKQYIGYGVYIAVDRARDQILLICPREEGTHYIALTNQEIHNVVMVAQRAGVMR